MQHDPCECAWQFMVKSPHVAPTHTPVSLTQRSEPGPPVVYSIHLPSTKGPDPPDVALGPLTSLHAPWLNDPPSRVGTRLPPTASRRSRRPGTEETREQMLHALLEVRQGPGLARYQLARLPHSGGHMSATTNWPSPSKTSNGNAPAAIMMLARFTE